MGPFRGPYRGSPLWEEMLMGPFRGGTHSYQSGLLLPQHISSLLSSQPADVFTKSLSTPLFHRFLCKLGMVDSIQPAPF